MRPAISASIFSPNVCANWRFSIAASKSLSNDERTQKKHEFFYKGGLLSFVEHLNRAKSAIHPKVVHFEGEKDGVDIEIAMQWNDGYSENVFSFCNNINTIEGGTHLIGFRSALDTLDQQLRAQRRPA